MKNQPTAVQYAAIMKLLMPSLAFVARNGLTSLDIIACLQAGRLAAEYDDWKVTTDGMLLGSTLAEYVALRDVHGCLHAQDLIARQQSARRHFLVAMGQLEESDA